MTPKESHYYRNDFELLNSEFLNNKNHLACGVVFLLVQGI